MRQMIKSVRLRLWVCSALKIQVLKNFTVLVTYDLTTWRVTPHSSYFSTALPIPLAL